jgi:hypothetical protein
MEDGRGRQIEDGRLKIEDGKRDADRESRIELGLRSSMREIEVWRKNGYYKKLS